MRDRARRTAQMDTETAEEREATLQPIGDLQASESSETRDPGYCNSA